MEKLFIVCVEDQREILTIVAQQLKRFESHIYLEECESAIEALEVMDEIDSNGDKIAVVISDHVMPEMTGVKFLSELKEDHRFRGTKKILLTGQATHLDTIEAINEARIDKYIEKPWQPEDLQDKVSRLLTEYIMEQGLDYQLYVELLDKQRLFELIQRR